MLLIVEKGIRREICRAVHRYAKANNKYMKDYYETKESSYLKYWDVNNLYGWAMSQKLPVNNFEWIGDTSQFNEDFIKNYNEESEERYFLEDDIQYPKKLHELKNNDLPLCLFLSLFLFFVVSFFLIFFVIIDNCLKEFSILRSS